VGKSGIETTLSWDTSDSTWYFTFDFHFITTRNLYCIVQRCNVFNVRICEIILCVHVWNGVQLSVAGDIEMNFNLKQIWACAASFVGLSNRRRPRHHSRPRILYEDASDDSPVRSYANCEVLLSKTLKNRSTQKCQWLI